MNKSTLLVLCIAIFALPSVARVRANVVINDPDAIAAERIALAHACFQQKRFALWNENVHGIAKVIDRCMNEVAAGDHTHEKDLKQIRSMVIALPLPDNVSTAALRKLRAGEWHSWDHNAIYHADGTWLADPGIDDKTTGHWHIEDRRYSSGPDKKFTAAGTYTIILLDQDYFLYKQGDKLFFERRRPSSWPSAIPASVSQAAR